MNQVRCKIKNILFCASKDVNHKIYEKIGLKLLVVCTSTDCNNGMHCIKEEENA